MLQVWKYHAYMRVKCCIIPCSIIRVGVCVQNVRADRWRSPHTGVQDNLADFRLCYFLIAEMQGLPTLPTKYCRRRYLQHRSSCRVPTNLHSYNFVSLLDSRSQNRHALPTSSSTPLLRCQHGFLGKNRMISSYRGQRSVKITSTVQNESGREGISSSLVWP